MTISYQNQFVFPVYVLNIFIIKLNLRTNISLTYTVSIVQWNFGIFIWQNILYFSLLNFNDWCFSTILWKLSDDLNKRNLSKTCPKSTYPIDFCKICSNLISREKWKYSIYWKTMNRQKLLYIVSYDKRFSTRHKIATLPSSRGRLDISEGLDLIKLPYFLYVFGKTDHSSVDPDQTPQNAVSDQDLHHLSLIQQFYTH